MFFNSKTRLTLGHAWLRTYSWLCFERELLVMLGAPFGMPGIEPWSLVSRQGPYPMYYITLGPQNLICIGAAKKLQLNIKFKLRLV